MKNRIAVLFFLISSLSLFSFTFEPISTNYTPSGPRSNQVFRISNNEGGRIAVRVSVTTREYDLKGNEINNPADGLFMIYPSRMVLEPGDTKSVRVKWNGDSSPDTELPFRIMAEQIPVDFEPTERTDGGGIRLSFKYIGNIYILPPGGKPLVEIDSYEYKDGKLSLVLNNTGTRHTLMENLIIKIISSEGEELYQLSEQEALPGKGINLLTGYPRLIEFAIEDPASIPGSGTGWEVDIDFDPVF